MGTLRMRKRIQPAAEDDGYLSGFESALNPLPTATICRIPAALTPWDDAPASGVGDGAGRGRHA
jgi:hypothetical protein